jgi:hypothetical protein
VVGLVIIGAVVLSQAYPSIESPTVNVLPTPSTSVSPTSTPTKPVKQEPPDLTGVLIAVFNGTNTTDLAANTAQKLASRFGVDPAQFGNAPANRDTTGIYYRNDRDKELAEYLAKKFFKGADVGPLPAEAAADVQKGVRIAIYIGNDYASTLGQ